MHNLSFCCFLREVKIFMKHHVIVTDEHYQDLNPISFGYQNCPKSHYFGPAIRTYWLIHFVVSGCGIFKIRGKTYNVKAGEMFVIPPFEEVYYCADDKTPWNYIWIGFTSESPILNYLKDVILCPQAEKIFQQMKGCEAYSVGRSAYLLGKLWGLFAILSKEEKPHTDYVDMALEYIHSEYMHDITVEGIARHLNLDRTYFSVIFKKKIGMAPKQYLLNYRMNIAASLISKNNISVTIAANSVGYSDLFTFSKTFKHHFGVSPSEYVKKFGN